MSLLERARFQPEAELIENLFERFQLEGIIHHDEGKEAGAYDEYVMSSQLRLTLIDTQGARDLRGVTRQTDRAQARILVPGGVLGGRSYRQDVASASCPL